MSQPILIRKIRTLLRLLRKLVSYTFRNKAFYTFAKNHIPRWTLAIVRILPNQKVRNSEPFPLLIRIYQSYIFIIRHAFNQQTSAARQQIAENYIIPAICLLYDKNYVNFAQLTLLSIEEYFLSHKTDADFEAALARFSPAAIAAGLRHRQAFPLKTTLRASPLRLAFVGHFLAISGYEVVLGLGKHLQTFQPAMHAMRQFNVPNEETTADAFTRNGFSFHLTGNDLYDVFTLRRQLEKTPADIVLWALPPMHMFFFFAFGLAPRQVWFSNYLRSNLAFPHLDDVLTPGGAGTISHKSYNRRQWSILPQTTYINGITDTSPTPFQPLSESKNFTLFTPARLEKLKQPEFLESVATILKNHPHAVFKWTGYYKDQEVIDFFAARGLSGRHVYLPWLNHDGLMREIKDSDLLLACFPLSLGTVEMIAAHLHVPVLSLYDEEFNLYWRDIFWEAQQGNPYLRDICLDENGSSHILIAKTPAEYVAAADALVSNKDLLETYRRIYSETYQYAYLNNPNDIGGMFARFVENMSHQGE
ncbi:MAG: hypothetical protein EON60_00170 [Alphaproteobacteria bacterium]|nr:MAG: hypothetical protein EON60_00170 [Alphaproteobacteria bacterium]